MKYELSNDEGTLTIFIDESEQMEFRTAVENGITEMDALEPLICNSELCWVTSAQTGDLISENAPILAYMDEAGEVTHRWAYLDYAVKCMLCELARCGKIELKGGEL